MKTFNIYTHPAHETQVVKIGFTWPGFLFGIFWMLFRKLWAHSAALFALGLVLGLLFPAEKDLYALSLQLAAQLGIGVFIGTSGNQWRENDLLRRGFQKASAVDAENADAARSLFHNGQAKN
ncbi:MAG: DUF2628 domain-containing protein [Azoarcus sp.]|jgi:hypothetical protein|nr:DUF2628 domain-containing protein [Azoarcus sp.]